MTKIIPALIIFLITWSSFAADPNGYTTQYECRAGGPNCNVDVVGLTTAACAQTITTVDSLSTIESKLNTGSSPICITNGDYTGKGRIIITASGSAGNYRVLRYFRSGDNNDEPWNQSDGDKVKIHQLFVNANYWIIHRLTFPANGGTTSPRVVSGWTNGLHDHIFNRIYVEGNGRGNAGYYGYSQDNNEGQRYSNLWVQNSVFRNGGVTGPPAEKVAINMEAGDNLYTVNNEVYNWTSHATQLGNNDIPTNLNTIVENNDYYVTSDYYSDCAGHYTTAGPCSTAESLISVKIKATAGNHAKIIHNRLWGTRLTDLNLCCNGEDGNAFTHYDNNNFILFQNNIISDAQIGINNVAPNNSYLGNLFYHIQQFAGGTSSRPINVWIRGGMPDQHDYEVYLNTAIDSHGGWPTSDHSNVDIKCNVIIDGGSPSNGTPPSTNIVDSNVFYNSTFYTYNGTNSNINKSITLKTAYTGCTTLGCTATENTAGLSVGDIVRTSSTPFTSCTSNNKHCYLYKVNTVGASGQIQAFRGPYSYWRKLRTAPEQVFIAYARAHSSAPEVGLCPSRYDSRAGLGVAD